MTGGLQKRLGCCEESSEGVTGSKHVWTSQMSIKLRVRKVTERCSGSKPTFHNQDSCTESIN